MKDTQSFIHLDIKSIVGKIIPVQKKTKQLISLPDELNEHIHLQTFQQQQQLQKQTPSNFVSYYREQYNSQQQTYQLIFDIPFVQLDITQHNIDNPTPNHLFLHVHLSGHYERKMVSSYCRVEDIHANIIAFPVFMDESKQTKQLRHVSFDQDITLLQQKYSFVRVFSVKEVNRAYQSFTQPDKPEYVETSKKSKQLQQEESLHQQHVQHMSFSLLKEDKGLIPKGQERTPSKTLAKLSYFYGPNVKVKELNAKMDLLHEEQTQTYSWTEQFNMLLQHLTVPKYTIQQQLQHIHLETYIQNPKQLAVVAFLPHTHRVYNEVIVGCVLFEFVPAQLISKLNQTQDNRTTLAYIRLNHIAIDYKYDECVLDHKHYHQQKGVRTRLFQHAMDYCYTIYGKHNIVYNGTDRLMISFLRHYGFKQKKVSKHNSIIEKLYQSITITHPIYIYKSSSLKCSSWDECKQVVDDNYPELNLKRKLMLASKLYGKKTKQSSKQRVQHYPVSVSTGMTLLQQYYAQHYLFPYNIQLKETRDAYEKKMLEPETKHQLELYCNAIRNHLKRSRKHILLHPDKKNTWKFRPVEPSINHATSLKRTSRKQQTKPNKKTLSSSIRYGPDKYALHGLDAVSEPGLSLMNMPLGRGTPLSLRQNTTTDITTSK